MKAGEEPARTSGQNSSEILSIPRLSFRYVQDKRRVGGDPLYVFPSTLYSLDQLSGSAGIVWSPSKLDEAKGTGKLARRPLSAAT